MNNKTINFIKDYGILLGIIFGPVLIILLLYVFSNPSINTSTKKQIHWHIPISYNLCGDTTPLKDQGEHLILHGHNGTEIHFEGIIDTKKRNENLGIYFNNTKTPFSQTQIGKYTNGDKCDGSSVPGKVSMFVNGKENFEFEKYIVNENDKIKITFK